jgi:pimeloyl-ACP methyl ester carboxylesterase
MQQPAPLAELPLPAGVRSRYVDNRNGCRMHVLEAGRPGAPCVVLLHGFPELAFSWRGQLAPLAQAGWHVVAPDQRGYGRSDGTEVRYEDDLLPFSPLNRVADVLGLVRALGHEQVHAVIGHDFGAHMAGWCALLRPDVFRSVVFMSSTFGGAPELAASPASSAVPGPQQAIADLAKLAVPRKHYWRYFASPQANDDMWHARQGVHDFLRAYFHVKSGDWDGNRPFALETWTAAELAKLPRYYVMDAAQDMAQTAAASLPVAGTGSATCRWLSEADLRVYSSEYARTGFQGGLQAYRVMGHAAINAELRAFAGRTVDVPSCYLSGERDWGTWQVPGGLERMRTAVCTRLQSVQFVPGAGHWVQQEATAEVNSRLLAFLARAQA